MKRTEDQEWQQILDIPGSVESAEEGWTEKNPWSDAKLCSDFKSTIADRSPQARICGVCAQCVFVGETDYYCKKGH